MTHARHSQGERGQADDGEQHEKAQHAPVEAHRLEVTVGVMAVIEPQALPDRASRLFGVAGLAAGLVLLLVAGRLGAPAAVQTFVLIFTSIVTCAVAVIVALLPVAVSRGHNLVDALRTGGRSSAASLGSLRRPSVQQLLIVTEIALAMTLLTAGCLMARSLLHQLRVGVGFDAQGVTVARLSLPAARYSPEQSRAFVAHLGEELRRQPLVRDAAVCTDLPFTGNVNAGTLVSDRDPENALRYYRHIVTTDFFATLRMPLLRGRMFTDHDEVGSPLVAIVSESGARRIWKGEEAVGRRFRTRGG